MQRERHDLLHVRTIMAIRGQRATGIESAIERAAIVELKVRVVPLAAKVERWRGAAAERRVIAGVKMRRLALEICPMRVLKIAGKSEVEFFSARSANHGIAGDMRQSQAF